MSARYPRVTTVRLTEATYRALMNASNWEGTSPSAMVRKFVDAGLVTWEPPKGRKTKGIRPKRRDWRHEPWWLKG